jgi:hypothetical protein
MLTLHNRVNAHAPQLLNAYKSGLFFGGFFKPLREFG